MTVFKSMLAVTQGFIAEANIWCNVRERIVRGRGSLHLAQSNRRFLRWLDEDGGPWFGNLRQWPQSSIFDVPQGLVLGPFLCICYTDEWAKTTKETINTRLLQCAANVCLHLIRQTAHALVWKCFNSVFILTKTKLGESAVHIVQELLTVK